MKLKKLLRDLPVQIKGSKEIEITGICAHSKRVAPGNLFIAKKGLTNEGSKFIPEAIASGAVAVLTDMYDPFLQDVVQIIHPDVAEVEAELAATYYNHAADHLFLVGITGTSGKTTISYLVKHLLDGVKMPCGLIGTIECIVGSTYLPSLLTSPDLLTMHKLFHEMVAKECKAAVMEVSSHALDQKRVRGVNFDVAIFSNLTQDHLDYHKTIGEYAAAKAKLFTSLGKEKVAIVCVDDPWSSFMLQGCNAQVLTYGIERPAHVYASDIVLSADKVKFDVHHEGKKAHFTVPLIGKFNVLNVLAATAVGLSRGASLEEIAHILRSFKRVAGRLEPVPNERGLNIFVDYAHKEDALRNVLLTLKEMKKGKIITVFGCGGCRDTDKRPKMGRVAELYSDVAIVTSDNPRTEEPEEIIRQILAGFENPGKALVIVDRKEAIHRAVSLATKEDIILIAGKGHETTQTFANQMIQFDDRVIAKQATSA